MARIRTIKPEFFTSLTIADLTVEQRLTFIGLWTHVDDDGRCVADPRLVKAAVWPLDDRAAGDVAGDLRALSESSLIVHYEVGGRRYIQVQGWSEHQRINRPTRSKLPSPDNGSPVPVVWPLTSGSAGGGVPLTEGSVSAPDGKGTGNREQGTGRNPLSTDVDGRDANALKLVQEDHGDPVADMFEEQFWPRYPKRDGKRLGKADALAAWRRLSDEQRERAIVGARNLAESGQRPKDPVRFLRATPAGALPFEDWQEPAVPTEGGGLRMLTPKEQQTERSRGNVDRTIARLRGSGLLQERGR